MSTNWFRNNASMLNEKVALGKNNLKKVLSGIAILGLAFSAVACSPTEQSDKGNEQENNESSEANSGSETLAGPVNGGRLIIGQDSIQPNLEPHPGTITYPQRISFDLHYESLMRIDEQGEFQPSLATEWEQESDTKITFKLREGVTFHNGNPFTAEDVVYTMERILDPDRPSDAGTKMKKVSKVEALDEYTVAFELEEPFVPFMAYLGSPEVVPILDAESADSTEYETQAIGTGPFQVVEFIPGDVMKLDAYEGYWNDDHPYLEGIDIRVITDDSTRLASIKTGEIQMATFRSDQDRQIAALSGVNVAPGGDYVSGHTSGMEMLVNCTVPGLDDVRVRQALALSIDHNQLMNTVIPGDNLASPSMHAPSGDAIFGYKGDGSDIPHYARNVEKAKELLADAGYAEGELTFELAFANDPSLASYARASEVVADQAADAGINIKLTPVDYAAATALQTEGSYVLYMGTGTAIMDVDPDSYYVASHSTSPRSTCKDPQIDKLIEEQRAEQDQGKRVEIINELNTYIADQVTAVTLFAMQSRFEVWSETLEGYEPRPNVRRYTLQNAWFNNLD